MRPFKILSVLTLLVSLALVRPATAATTATFEWQGTHQTSTSLGATPTSAAWYAGSSVCAGVGASTFDAGILCSFSVSGWLTGTCGAWSGTASGWLYYGWGGLYFEGYAKKTASQILVFGTGIYWNGDIGPVTAVITTSPILNTSCEYFSGIGTTTATLI